MNFYAIQFGDIKIFVFPNKWDLSWGECVHALGHYFTTFQTESEWMYEGQSVPSLFSFVREAGLRKQKSSLHACGLCLQSLRHDEATFPSSCQ